MKLLSKLVNYFKSKFMKAKEIPIYTLNRAARRRLQKTVQQVYQKNIRSELGFIARKERRFLAKVKAKAYVEKEAFLQLHPEQKFKTALITKLQEWTGRIRIWRIKQREALKAKLAVSKPAPATT